MLKISAACFVSMVYSGFMVILTRQLIFHKISTCLKWEKNYEKILAIYNDCFQGKVSNLFINIAGTKDFFREWTQRFVQYQASENQDWKQTKFETVEVRDFAQPVIKLLPLDNNEVFVLL